MKRFSFYILILYFFQTSFVFSQEVLIGKPLLNHHVVNYNLNLNKKPHSNIEYTYLSDSLLFYLDADEKPDLVVMATYYFNKNSGKKREIIEVIPCEGTELACTNNVKETYYKLKKFEVGDNIRTHVTWKGNSKNSSKIRTVAYYLSSTKGVLNNKYSQLDTTDNFFIAFRTPIVNDTIYGWMRLSNIFPGKVKEYSFSCVRDYLPPMNIEYLSSNKICSNNMLALNFNPQDGNITGRGIKDRLFHPASIGHGQQIIVYTTCNPRGCPNTYSVNITVNKAPQVSLEIKEIGRDSIRLVGLPAGGNYSVKGLPGNLLVAAKTSTFFVKYEYTDSLGCNNSAWITKTNTSIVKSDSKPDISTEEFTTNLGNFYSYLYMSDFNEASLVIAVIGFPIVIILAIVGTFNAKSKRKKG